MSGKRKVQMKVWQQGDVVAKRIEAFPEGERIQDSQAQAKILAYGEATGHAHRLDDPENAVEVFRILNRLYISVTAPVALNHEEHKTITMPPGKYEIEIVRETDHLAGVVRRVAD